MGATRRDFDNLNVTPRDHPRGRGGGRGNALLRPGEAPDEVIVLALEGVKESGLGDRTVDKDNDPQWQTLFVQSIA